jgi:coenzyme F420-reducing hydrogenase delta subunit
MTECVCPDSVSVYVCRNCFPNGEHPKRQWRQDGVHVQVHEVPCSGKIDIQYLFHALEDGGRGICVVACPQGQCKLAQGNFRAEIRIRTVQQLLGEIGLEPERVQLLHCGADDPAERVEELARNVVARICAMGPSSLHLSAEQTLPPTSERVTLKEHANGHMEGTESTPDHRDQTRG